MWRDFPFIKSFLFNVLLLLMEASYSSAQTTETSYLPFQHFELQNLKEFGRTKGKQWKIAGDAFMDRHQKFHVELSSGKGLLTGTSVRGREQKITTLLKHGDIDLDFDFMLSKGSNAKVLLQERYQIFLTDSWKNGNDKSDNCGSISGPETGSSQPAKSDACKAPGLWQHLSVRFKAPRFNELGNKVASAVFAEIKLNGQIIHKNLAIDQPSYSSSYRYEQKTAGLTFITGEGTVAFRNLRYKTYEDSSKIHLSNLNFEVYKGLFKNYDTLKNFTPLRTGKSDSLSWRVGDRKSLLVLKGTIELPRQGDHLFELKAGGPAWLLIDDKEVLNNGRTRDFTRSFFGKVSLPAGLHRFKIIYSNSDESLVLNYEGPQIPLTLLTTVASARKIHENVPLRILVEEKAVYQRGFMMHQGKVNPYILSVGMPGGLNFSYDMSTCNLINAWQGKFIDVSNMWTERGESQLEIPLGPLVEFERGVSIARLADSSIPFPELVMAEDNPLSQRRYRLNEKGVPVFQYQFVEASVEDFVCVSNDRSGITREVQVETKSPARDLYILIAKGNAIERLANGAYAINDKEYYVESIKGVNEQRLVITKNKSGQYQLLLPLNPDDKTLQFNYTIVW